MRPVASSDVTSGCASECFDLQPCGATSDTPEAGVLSACKTSCIAENCLGGLTEREAQTIVHGNSVSNNVFQCRVRHTSLTPSSLLCFIHSIGVDGGFETAAAPPPQMSDAERLKRAKVGRLN